MKNTALSSKWHEVSLYKGWTVTHKNTQQCIDVDQSKEDKKIVQLLINQIKKTSQILNKCGFIGY